MSPDDGDAAAADALARRGRWPLLAVACGAWDLAAADWPGAYAALVVAVIGGMAAGMAWLAVLAGPADPGPADDAEAADDRRSDAAGPDPG